MLHPEEVGDRREQAVGGPAQVQLLGRDLLEAADIVSPEGDAGESRVQAGPHDRRVELPPARPVAAPDVRVALDARVTLAGEVEAPALSMLGEALVGSF